MNKRTIFALFTVAALVMGSLLSLNGQPVSAQDHSPSFSVFIESNHVKGWDWPLGVEITLEINDPATPEDPDYSENQYAHEVLGSFNEVHFGPEEAFAMAPGHSVTLSGGGYTKETIITFLAFGGVDMPGDSLWGYADPGEVVTVKNWQDRNIVRWETTDGSGNWEADFSVLGDQPGEERLHDFSLGTRIMIFQEDGDGDKTQLRDWMMPFPTMEVRLTQNILEAQDWPPGYPVNIAIDDPKTGPGDDYTNTVSPEACWFDSNQGCIWLPLGEDYRLNPGDSLTLSNGFLTKMHTVSTLQVSAFDYDTDLMCGVAEPGFEVETRFQYDDQFFQRYEIAAPDGSWCADFSVPGDEEREQNTYDLLPFTEGTAHLRDEDGDTTQLTFPYNLVVWPDGGNVEGNNWLADVPVTIEIDDPLTPAVPDYTASAIPVEGPWFLTRVQFDLYELFDLQPGHVVRFIQEDRFKELVVSGDLTITEINYLADTASGTAAPSAHILTIHGYGGAARVTIADSAGNWSVDYSVPGDHIIENETVDLLPGDNFMAAQSDADSDQTNISRSIPTPVMRVRLTAGEIYAQNYLPGYPVTLTIYQPGDLVNPVYTYIKVMGDDNLIVFEYPGVLDLGTGYLVRTTDGVVTKEHTVTAVWINDIGMDLDRVYGVAKAGTTVTVVARSATVRAQRNLVAGLDGTWMADFSVPGAEPWEQDTIDLDTAYITFAYQTDDDNDITWVHWMLNQPPEVGAISGAADPAPVNSLIQVSASFSDPDPGDAHSAIWDWGDGTTFEGVVDEGSGTVSGSHIYSQAGVYTLSLTLCDAAGDCDTAGYQYVVVYDSEGGFVTGGGYIDSLADAYKPDPSITGKATFGFVSKYKKGANVPTGNTEFQFKTADFNFHSDSYQWLVVTGSDYAKFKGTGTINGVGEYKFMIWAGDNEPDTFRIKIWWEDTEGEHVVYDNGMNQAIGGGSIVIHTK